MKKLRIFNRILIVILLLFILNTYSVNATSIWQSSKEWLRLGQSSNTAIGAGTSNSGIADLSGLLFGAGIFISAIVGIIIGIKFMLVSPEEKAKLKKDLIPYIVGTFIIIGALGIWKFVVNALEGIAH